MQGNRISGKDVVVTLPSGIMGAWDQITVTPELGVAVASDRGRPAGWVRGSASAEVEITLPTPELMKLNDEADVAGSWEQLAAMDVTFYAKADNEELRVDAFGLKLNAPDFTFTGEGGEKLTHKLKGIVTGENFIHINGVPLLKRPE
ncbi:MAG TPA: phage protein [bacterium]